MALSTGQGGGAGRGGKRGGNSPFKLKPWHLREDAVRAVFIFGKQNMYILFS